MSGTEAAAWRRGANSKAGRLAQAKDIARGKWVEAENATALLERLLRPGDRLCVEGNNQKQADFLAEALAAVNPQQIFDLHMVQSVVALSNSYWPCSRRESRVRSTSPSRARKARSWRAWSVKARSGSTPFTPTSSCMGATLWI